MNCVRYLSQISCYTTTCKGYNIDCSILEMYPKRFANSFRQQYCNKCADANINNYL